MTRLRRKNSRQERHGATAVEFAMIAPIFVIVVLSSFEFARLNVLRHTADNAAYEAARHAMVPGGTATEAIAKANSVLNIVAARGAQVSITPAVLTPEMDEITVTVDIPLDQNGWITPRFTGTRTLRATSTLKAERISN